MESKQEITNMIKYLFASHGKFSEGTKSFLEIMSGDNPNIYTVTAFLDNQSEKDLIQKVLKEIGEFEQLIVFCDLYGGSVMQEVFRQTINDERDIQIIAGYNLALVLDIILRNAVLTKEEIQEIINANKEAIVYVERVVETSSDEDLF